MVDSVFDSVYAQTVGSIDTLLGYDKSLNVYNELQSIKHLEGNTAEIGVFQGATSKLIHTVMGRTHYAYDTYCGIQGSDPNEDCYRNGVFNCPLDVVKSNINMDGVVYRVGFFPDTFDTTTEGNEKFVFVHSDTDTYVGTKATLEYFAPLIVKGGKILFDDYKWHRCPGVEKATREFRDKDTEFDFREYNNQCVFTRK